MPSFVAALLRISSSSSASAIGSALRAAYREIAAPPSTVPEANIYGVPVARTPAWDATKGDALVGDFTKLLVGIHEDVTFDLSASSTTA